MERYLKSPLASLKGLIREVLYQFSIDQRELYITLISILSIFVIVPGLTFASFSADLITKDGVMNKNNTGLILLDRNGKEFFRFYQARNQTSIPLSDIPLFIQQAAIASEDKDFYSHSGFSLKAIARSAAKDIEHKAFIYGGSTITQQLVKNSLLSPDKNLIRKYQEVLLSQQIESKFTKPEILEMYLNSVYFGEGAFGIQEAAESYFGKSAKELNLAEAAILVGVLPAPTSYSPLSGSFDEAKIRQEIVLQKMLEQGYISQSEKNQALKTKLSFNPVKNENSTEAAHFALTVKDQLVSEYGEETISREGLVVKTTIDLELQQKALSEINKQLENLKNSNANNGAVVIIEPKSGEVLAMVGSRDWNDNRFGKVNLATRPRSPGSSFKPIIYSAAFEKGLITPSTILKDQPTQFKLSSNKFEKPYAPLNYDLRFRGPVTVRRALSNSLNVPAVEVMQMVGLDDGLAMAKRLGVSSLGNKSNYGLSLVLGTGEVSLLDMTGVYSVFANEGIKIEPTLISEINDKRGRTIYKHEVKREPVLQPEVAFLISSILSDNKSRAEEFGNLLTISKTAAVKTGTSNEYRDALTIGYTPDIVVGVWVGNNDNKPMSQIAGSLGAAPIWKNLMEYLLKDKPDKSFNPPPGVTQISVCSYNGLPLRNQEATSSARKEYFINGTVPTKYCVIPKPTPQPSPSDGSTPPPTSPTIPDIKPNDSQPVIQSKIEEAVKQNIKDAKKQLKKEA